MVKPIEETINIVSTTMVDSKEEKEEVKEEEEEAIRLPCQVVGIDLGTSYSSVAVMTSSGSVHVISNSQGFRCTPSVVAFTNKAEAEVGEAAKWQSSQNPANTVFEIKRLIGRRWDDPAVVAENKRATRTVQVINTHTRNETKPTRCYNATTASTHMC